MVRDMSLPNGGLIFNVSDYRLFYYSLRLACFFLTVDSIS